MDTLTRIRAFIDVVEAEGFSAAARKTGRSKALLSKYVRELEDELGALLLNRTTRQFSMTEAGHTYYRSATEILKEIDSLADLVRENNTDLKGKLKVTVPRTFIDAEVGQSLIDFATAHPDLSLEIVAEDRFVDLVEEGFDLAIRITKLDDSALIAKKLSDFRIFACATPAFVAKYGPLIHPQELARVPFLVDTNSRSHNSVRFADPQGGTISVSVSGRSRSTARSPRCAPRAPASASP
jgi:DNA-binding transcriptional LysR family regulator